MFHDQQLYDRAMKVRMDKMGGSESSGSQGIPDKLPGEFSLYFECQQCDLIFEFYLNEVISDRRIENHWHGTWYEWTATDEPRHCQYEQ